MSFGGAYGRGGQGQGGGHRPSSSSSSSPLNRAGPSSPSSYRRPVSTLSGALDLSLVHEQPVAGPSKRHTLAASIPSTQTQDPGPMETNDEADEQTTPSAMSAPWTVADSSQSVASHSQVQAELDAFLSSYEDWMTSIDPGGPSQSPFHQGRGLSTPVRNGACTSFRDHSASDADNRGISSISEAQEAGLSLFPSVLSGSFPTVVSEEDFNRAFADQHIQMSRTLSSRQAQQQRQPPPQQLFHQQIQQQQQAQQQQSTSVGQNNATASSSSLSSRLEALPEHGWALYFQPHTNQQQQQQSPVSFQQQHPKPPIVTTTMAPSSTGPPHSPSDVRQSGAIEARSVAAQSDGKAGSAPDVVPLGMLYWGSSSSSGGNGGADVNANAMHLGAPTMAGADYLLSGSSSSFDTSTGQEDYSFLSSTDGQPTRWVHGRDTPVSSPEMNSGLALYHEKAGLTPSPASSMILTPGSASLQRLPSSNAPPQQPSSPPEQRAQRWSRTWPRSQQQLSPATGAASNEGAGPSSGSGGGSGGVRHGTSSSRPTTSRSASSVQASVGSRLSFDGGAASSTGADHRSSRGGPTSRPLSGSYSYSTSPLQERRLSRSSGSLVHRVASPTALNPTSAGAMRGIGDGARSSDSLRSVTGGSQPGGVGGGGGTISARSSFQGGTMSARSSFIEGMTSLGVAEEGGVGGGGSLPRSSRRASASNQRVRYDEVTRALDTLRRFLKQKESMSSDMGGIEGDGSMAPGAGGGGLGMMRSASTASSLAMGGGGGGGGVSGGGPSSSSSSSRPSTATSTYSQHPRHASSASQLSSHSPAAPTMPRLRHVRGSLPARGSVYLAEGISDLTEVAAAASALSSITPQRQQAIASSSSTSPAQSSQQQQQHGVQQGASLQPRFPGPRARAGTSESDRLAALSDLAERVRQMSDDAARQQQYRRGGGGSES